MTSQIDLDQGGTARTWNKIFLGPSVGWVWVPNVSVLVVTSPGTYILDPSTNYVTVAVSGPVVITLPTTKVPVGGAQAQPNLFAQAPIVIVDVGGFAAGNPIIIQPASNAETIMGLSQISLSTNFGGYTLAPNSPQLTWNSISP